MVLESLGTRAFLPTLLEELNNASLSPIPLDSVIFQSILLVLASGHRKHLILRAIDPEEVGIIARTAEWTLSTVFNLATHRLKVRAGRKSTDTNEVVDPAAFLRSLFLSPSPSAEALHDERASSCGSIAQLAHQRSASGHKKLGSASGSTGYADPFADSRVSADSPVPHSPLQHPAQLDSTLPGSSYPHRRAPHARHSASSQHSKSKSKSRKPSTAVSTAHTQIPDALVVTGLEHACNTSQRALVRVLAEGRLALPRNTRVSGWSELQTREDDEEEAWDLPENFTLVYVTSWDPRERPAIHKSLLDKFCMSTNITIHSKTKEALRSISIGSTIAAANLNPFGSQTNSPYHHPHSVPSTPRSALGSLPPHPLPHPPTPHQQVVPLSEGTSNTSKSSATNAFLSEHEHHHVPSISTHQGTRSTSRTRSVSPFLSPIVLPSDPPDPLSHSVPSRPQVAATIAPNVEPGPGLPLATTFLPRLRHTVEHSTFISPSVNLYLQDLFTAARFDFPELDGTLLTARAMDDAEKLARACRVLGTELGGWELIRGSMPKSNGEVESKNDENDEQEEGDGSSETADATHGWEFEAGYNPGGAIAIELRVEDALPDVDANKTKRPQNPTLGKRKQKQKEKENMERQSGDNRPFRVMFDEVLSIRSVDRDWESEAETLDVSEADVARILPRVVSHRVRMRDNWTDQMMAGVVFRATSSAGKEEGEEEKMTVKDVLIRVLQKV